MMIEIASLSCGYSEKEVLHGISLSIADGDFAVLIGPNGAGKSTLLHALIGFLPVAGGSIQIKGKPLPDWHRRDLAKVLALIPQETVLPFDYTVLELALMGRFPHLELLQSYAPADVDIVLDILVRLELLDVKDRYYSQLSGGEKQRVLLARALAQQTEVILLDEALSQLDINHQIDMMRLLSDINRKEGKTILLVSHNLNLAANVSSHLILLKDGHLVANGNVEEVLTPQILEEVFGVQLQLMTNPLSGRPNLIYPGVG